MPLINHNGENVYRPGERLRNLYEETVLRPLRAQLPGLAVRLRDPNVMQRVRENVLDRGCTDFCQPYVGPSPLNPDAEQVSYSPAQKVLLYCAVYMPMHLYSSYHVYRTFLPTPSVTVLFVDVGCGPLTSGIAYRAFAEHADIAYIGIDRADEMINKAEKINERGCSGSSFFKCSALIYDYNSLPDFIRPYVSSAEGIFINCCYFLASHSLNANDFANALVQIMMRHPTLPMRIVYQNPPNQILHQNWQIVRRRLLRNGFAVCHEGIETFMYPDLITGRAIEKSVAYETLYKPPA